MRAYKLTSKAKPKTIKFQPSISFNTIAAGSSFYVAVDSSTGLRSAFLFAVRRCIDEMDCSTPNGLMRIFDTVESRIIVDTFVKKHCSKESGLKSFSDGQLYRIYN